MGRGREGGRANGLRDGRSGTGILPPINGRGGVPLWEISKNLKWFIVS